MTDKSTPEILFIINPNAGKRKTKKLIQQLKKYPAIIDYRFSEYPAHGSVIVAEEIDNYEVFVAVGGDGTVNEIASSLIGSDRKLAVLPNGSGNGFAREFGFRRIVEDLIKVVDRGNTLKADVIYLNDMPSVHVSGVGYDAEVAHYFSKLKGRGFWNYVASTLKIFFAFQPIEATIQYGSETISGEFFMINIVNNRQFGYNAIIAPKANPTDGVFELILVSKFPKWMFPLFSLQLFMGTLKPSKIMKVLSFRDEVVLTTAECKFHLDGDPVIIDSPVKIRIKPEQLNVVDTGRVRYI